MEYFNSIFFRMKLLYKIWNILNKLINENCLNFAIFSVYNDSSYTDLLKEIVKSKILASNHILVLFYLIFFLK